MLPGVRAPQVPDTVRGSDLRQVHHPLRQARLHHPLPQGTEVRVRLQARQVPHDLLGFGAQVYPNMSDS